MTDRLFDPTPHSLPRRNYRDERARTKVETPPDVARIALGDTWRLYNAGSHPEVHALGERPGVTLCDQPIGNQAGSLMPLTFEPGTPAAACPDCWRRGAR